MLIPIKELNEMLPSFYQAGTVNVIAGRPGMGKTSLIAQLYYAYAITANQDTARHAIFVGLEDSYSTWITKIISQQAEVEFEKVKDKENKCTGAEFQRVVATTNEIITATNSAFYSHFQDFSDVERIRETCEKFDVVFIDKLQLFPLKFNYNEFFSSLKRIAVETNCSIVITSDLDQGVEKRSGHRPLLTDFTNAPNVADHADSVIFIHRREYYDPMDKPSMAELIIAKNRLGATGQITTTFRKNIPCFFDYAPIKYETSEETLEKEYSHF